MTNATPSIGIIGGGLVARGIAELLDRRGYQVAIALPRYVDELDELRLPHSVRQTSLTSAARSDVVFLSVRHRAVRQVVKRVRQCLAGKVVIDTTSPHLVLDSVMAGLSENLTQGTWLARQLPQARVVRAFSHIDGTLLVSSARSAPGRWAVAYAADDGAAAVTARHLIEATGYVPVYIGTLAESNPLDAGGILWPYMSTPDDMEYVLMMLRDQESMA